MRYRVTARMIQDKMPDLRKGLTDGTIQGQEPDGQEIVASMRRARLTPPDLVQWYETCYCPTPLAHERETVYDRFFTQIETLEVTSEPPIEGESFWGYLEGLAR